METVEGTITEVSDMESRVMGVKPKAQRVRGGRHGGTQSDGAAVPRVPATRYQALLGPVRLLSTPPQVKKALEREVEVMAAQGRPIVGEARERLLESLKLRYYFGGQPIAYRKTDHGKEVLAVGYKEMRRLFRELTPEEDEAVTSGFAEPWQSPPRSASRWKRDPSRPAQG